VKYLTWTVLLLIIGGSTSSKMSRGASAGSPNSPGGNAKNVVLLIGDGMGLAQISTFYTDKKQWSGFDEFPVIGFQKTHSSDHLVTDSAAGATAMACGKKTFNNAIGLDSTGAPCKTILEEAEDVGLSTGLIVTSSIVHATPAAFLAHCSSRNNYEDIAKDYMNTEVDLLIGGGKQYFDRRKKDDLDLVENLERRDYAVYDYFNQELEKMTLSPKKNFVFFTADNQPLPASHMRTYLPYAARAGMNFLNQRSEKGFFLMIEGSQIDWACHANRPNLLLTEMEDFDNTIRQVLEFARRDGETLVIVTSDHETGGVGLNQGNTRNRPEYAFTSNGHTATMVPVFAYGPGAALFSGIYDNTAIYQKMRKALGFN
jgi:alkaline phosphatase